MELALFKTEMEDLCKLFSEVSGIGATWLPEKDEKTDISFADSLPVAHIRLKEDGLCQLVIPVFVHGVKKGVALSEPILCLYPSVSLTENKNGSDNASKLRSSLILSPARLEKALCLLARTITGKTDEWQRKKVEYRAVFSELLKRESAAPLKAFLDRSLETIIMKNGDHFVKTKADCLRFVFMLHEYMQDMSMHYKAESWTTKRLIQLHAARSIGQLKSCLDQASQEFLQTACRHCSAGQNQFIQKALTLVAQNYPQKITQNAVAHAVYLSPSYFSKLFKDALGCNFTQYVNQFRIERAKALLENPNIEIDTVYSRVGYDDRSYFGKVFRQFTGTTPKRYRDSLNL